MRVQNPLEPFQKYIFLTRTSYIITMIIVYQNISLKLSTHHIFPELLEISKPFRNGINKF